jgi:serine/threonine protein kinase
MWSLGVLLFTMLCRTLPWSVESGDMQNAQIQTASVQWLPSAGRAIPLSEEAKDLITKLLRVDVSQRLTPEQILDGHEWLRPNLDSAGEDAVAAVHARGGGGSGANGASGGASGGASSGGESPAKRARKE